ncbi:huntingtin-interacting protein K [Macrochelys suwanniensis]
MTDTMPPFMSGESSPMLLPVPLCHLYTRNKAMIQGQRWRHRGPDVIINVTFSSLLPFSKAVVPKVWGVCHTRDAWRDSGQAPPRGQGGSATQPCSTPGPRLPKQTELYQKCNIHPTSSGAVVLKQGYVYPWEYTAVFRGYLAEGDVELKTEPNGAGGGTDGVRGRLAEKPRKHDSSAADLEWVMDYVEEKEIQSSNLETAMSVIGDRRSREQKATHLDQCFSACGLHLPQRSRDRFRWSHAQGWH